jgi:hypothetical protein
MGIRVAAPHAVATGERFLQPSLTSERSLQETLARRPGATTVQGLLG